MRWFASQISLGEARRGKLVYAQHSLIKAAYTPLDWPPFSALALVWWAAMTAAQEELVEGMWRKYIFLV